MTRNDTIKFEKGMIEISTDKSRLDLDYIHSYLSLESYWGKGRTKEIVKRSIENSLSFGIYDCENQIGFARVITDLATFAYLADVFIDEKYRGRGLSIRLLNEIKDFPELLNIRRWLLATRDAHELYRKFGFGPLEESERWMEILNNGGKQMF